MGNLRGIICRLCLEKRVDFKTAEAYIKDVLDILLLKINLAVSEEPYICTNCAATLMRCFDFKAACFYTHDYIVPFLDDDKISKLDLRKLYVSKHENVDIPDDHGICGFCLEIAEKCTAVSLDGDEGDVMLEKLIVKCLPELDISTIKEPIICAACHESLMTYFHFVTSCLIVEEKVIEYRKLTGADVIELADVLQSTSKDISKVKEDGNMIDVISTEGKFCVDMENTDEQVGHKNGSFVHMEEQKLLPKEEVEIKTDQHDFDRCLDSVVATQPITTKSRGRKTCLRSKDGSDSVMYQCLSCSFKTKHKCSVYRHITLNHKDASEVTMYQCKSCPYQTRVKGNLRRHFIIHKPSSEIKLYKCDACSFQTNQKLSLQRHMITHKLSSEVTMYPCPSCSFRTKHKCSLRTHMLTHKDPSVTIYRCMSCSYQTKQKKNLTRHLVVHKPSSEIRRYQCDACSYHTNEKYPLQRHMIIHKLPSETTMYQCHSCSFKTRRKEGLHRHMVVHKDPSEVTMYKCASCPYQTKHKRNLIQHFLIHKRPSKMTMPSEAHGHPQTPQ